MCRCTPFTQLCMSLTCRGLHNFKEIVSVPKFTGLLQVRHLTLVSVVRRNVLFVCWNMLGEDTTAEAKLRLIDDYWCCKKANYKSFIIHKDGSGRHVFLGKLMEDGTPDRERCLSDVHMYISPRARQATFSIEAKFRCFTTLSDLAKDHWRVCHHDLFNDYLTDERSWRDMNSFTKFKFLESMIGQSRASLFLADFTFDEQYHGLNFVNKVWFCVQNGVDYFDHYLLPNAP